MVYNMSGEPSIIEKAEDRQSSTFDDHYTKVEADPYVQELHHL
jgi:hypothetical protein